MARPTISELGNHPSRLHRSRPPSEDAAHGCGVRDDRIASKGQTGQRALTRGLIATAARVADEDRDVSKVCRVTHRRLTGFANVEEDYADKCRLADGLAPA